MAAIGERVGPFRLTGRQQASEGLELWDAVRADDTQKEPREAWIRLATTEEGALRLRSEYEALRLIQDPRVPAVVGFFAGQGALATARFEGIRLSWVLRAARDGFVNLDPATVMDIALELAHALRAGHSILAAEPRIVHGAMTPDAIRIGPKGGLNLVGFGAGEPCPGNYRAPEVLAGAPPSQASDQWQLGALLFELLTLRPLVLPLPLPTMRKDPGRQLEALQPEDRRLLRKMLADQPEDRFGVARELLHALHQRAREVGGASQRERLYERVMAFRERLEDPTEVPDASPETLPSDEPAAEVTAPLEVTRTLDQELPPDDDSDEPEASPTEPLPSLGDNVPAAPARPARPAAAQEPRKSLLGEWTVLLSFFLFVVAALWFVLRRML